MVKAFGLAALVGVASVLVADAVGLTDFAAGFCCGFERDILPDFALITWYGTIAVLVGGLFGIERAAVSARQRVLTVVSAAAGACVALAAVSLVVSRIPADARAFAPSRMVAAYGVGVAIGLVLALLVVLTPARRTVVRGGLLTAIGVIWLSDLAVTIAADRARRISPGGLDLIAIPFSLGLLPYLAAVLSWGILGSTIVGRMRGRNWRTAETWLVAAAAVVVFGAVVRLTVYVSDEASQPLQRLVGFVGPSVLSTSLVYAALGIGVVIGVWRCTDAPPWVAVAAAAGFVTVAASMRAALLLSPGLGGEAALDAGWYSIGFGLLVAIIGGAVTGMVRHRSRVVRTSPSPV
jgi:hypothetical protein